MRLIECKGVETTKGYIMTQETLGQRIKAERIKRGWSQEELADKIGVSSLSVIRWEHERAIPRDDSVRIALMEEFGFRKEDFTKRKTAQAQSEETVSSSSHPLSPVELVIPLGHEIRESEVPHAEILDGIEIIISPIKRYQGRLELQEGAQYKKRHVTVDSQPLPYYDPYYDPKTISYGWGHTGGGPRALAASILLDYLKTMSPHEEEQVLRTQAWKYSFNFKMDFVAWFDKEKWEIWSGAITAWLKEQKAGGDPAPEHSLADIAHGWSGWSERWDK